MHSWTGLMKTEEKWGVTGQTIHMVWTEKKNSLGVI